MYGYNDPLSRLRTNTYQSGSPDDVAKDYDNANNVTRIASTNGGTIEPSYDEVNRVYSQKWTYSGKLYTTTYNYDSKGCLYSMTYPTGTIVTMTCDSANRVKTISIGSSSIVSNISYHPSGQVKGMTYGNSKSTTLTYDDRARAKTIASSGVIGLTYGYDGADNVVSFNNTVVPNSSRTMTYTKLDQLWTSVAQSLWGSAVYDYDALGNRIMKSVGNYTTTYTYGDSQNRLDSAEGGPAPFKTMTFAWDLAGRLASSSDGVSYLYDGLGRRIQKTEPTQTTLYHYDASGRIISETSPAGAKIRDYIYLGNKLVAVDGCITVSPPSACNERQWYHTDIAGSVLARSDSSGNVVRYDYQPWGEPWTAPTTAAGDRQYNGRIFDQGTGFHDYGARMYWPEIGRFISVDIAGPSAAVPATFNRYAYVLNNPYKYIDPNGRWPTEIHKDIIREALQDVLSLEQLQILFDASAYVDRLANQTQAGNHEHAMRSPDEKPADARGAIDARISGMSAYAQMLQGTPPGSSADINPEALRIFGEGGHTVMDRTSPAHTDPNGDPLVGWGIPSNSIEGVLAAMHWFEERTISPAQRAAAAQALRDYFISTFGELTLDMATAGPDIFIQPDAGSSDIFIQP